MKAIDHSLLKLDKKSSFTLKIENDLNDDDI